MKVYVAGPMGPEDGPLRSENIRRGKEAGIKLALEGHSPFIPHLWDSLVGMEGESSIDYESKLRMDFDWLAVCGCMLRLPGVSPGADRERTFADSLGIPVFDTMEELLAWCNK